MASDSVRAVRDLVVTILTDLRQLGMLRPELDVEVEAVRLHALLDGLTLQLIVAPELNSRDEARGALEQWLCDLQPRGGRG